MPSFRSIGDGLDNVMMDSAWSSMHIEMLNWRKWKTQIELVKAIFDYIEIFSIVEMDDDLDLDDLRISRRKVDTNTIITEFPVATTKTELESRPHISS